MKVWFILSVFMKPEPIPYIRLEGLATCRAARKLQTCPSLCMALSMYRSCKFRTDHRTSLAGTKCTGAGECLLTISGFPHFLK